MSVTRGEIIDLIGFVFERGPAMRDEILAAALEQRARPKILETLERLPMRPYCHMGELWDEIPEVPSEA